MIALWMTYATVVGGILAAGAALVERATSGGLRQRRWIPILALALSVAVPVWTVVTPRPVIAAATPNAGPAVGSWRWQQQERLEAAARSRRQSACGYLDVQMRTATSTRKTANARLSCTAVSRWASFAPKNAPKNNPIAIMSAARTSRSPVR